MKRRRPRWTLNQRLEALAFVLMLTLILLFTFMRPMTELERTLVRGELVVATRISTTTYQPWSEGSDGLEYDLTTAFADSLGVRLKLVVPGRFDEILPMVAGGRVDMAAAGITMTRARLGEVRFGPAYHQVTEQVVYRSGEPAPESLDELQQHPLTVIAGSSHVETLAMLRRQYPDLQWEELAGITPEELLRQVWEGKVALAVADSIELASMRRFYPELRAAMDLSEPHFLAWAFPRHKDRTLIQAAERFFEAYAADGRLAQLLERHYGHMEVLDYPGILTFMNRIRERLPRHEPLFREAAEYYDVDWRLLAAISYQESHWNPNAVSRTGVRGLMMLTQATAGQLGVQDRTDPRESVFGGAEYFMNLHERLPMGISEPDRTWMALAAYNVGMGHLHDARRITRAQDKDPDRWIDVMEHLPLLSQPNWYSNTRYGYARGWEPVQYVQNIRGFYDILTWFTTPEQSREQRPPSDSAPPATHPPDPLEILPLGL
ncbi:membrane-bound lytic murein transglycosylase MltF [Ectothiorhodospira lacustris]|uniref:membrane-bound lytic murein transglycosylase MltF n=1 Tax=Ectothiorhodospira lacustris TaxID=2899127 RepID=UPI001EE818D6|nr:membrane-bound lytic murein transglycosylase MltF [Ectothiorhodospira lacustris]MCG5499997.1 membrane-bound lytic murein transglycosylase MltF [Ectothiorhodospira lacustris]MCG5510967.1 membrane-bound lytic murein transglycosylase MltF [Ectothiorhodospira lacustris]MCG5522699.1 membrane-bound lytic murein transglycosylase MltF [Ectothiorhodospira lacustris]